MRQLFSTEGKVYGVMERLYQLILLNILFILSSLPLVTIGAALAAAYGTAYKVIDYKEQTLYQEYLRQFKRNFVPATKIWFITVVGIISSFVVFPYIRLLLSGNVVIYYFLMLMITVLILMNGYIYPLIARFENSSIGVLKNALLLSLKHLPISIVLFLSTVGIGFAVPFYVPSLIIPWLFVGSGFLFFIQAKILLNVFKRYENLEERS